MTTHVIVGIVAFVCGIVCAITGTVVVFEMVDRVNERLPQQQQFSPIWWYPSKYYRLFAEYRRLYPAGTYPEISSPGAAALRMLFYLCLGTGILLSIN